MVKFKRLDNTDFHMKYSDAADALEDEDVPQTLPRTYGEVKIPGHGWYPCVMNDFGEPAFFWNEDEGWMACPRNQTFQEVLVP